VGHKFSSVFAKISEYSPKNGFGTDLGKKLLRNFCKHCHPKPVQNPFQIRHLELEIWVCGRKNELWQAPIMRIAWQPLLKYVNPLPISIHSDGCHLKREIQYLTIMVANNLTYSLLKHISFFSSYF